VDGNIALDIAIFQGSLEFVQCLADNGAKVNYRECRGHSGIDNAIVHGQVEVAEILLKQGADVQSVDQDGRTTLHHLAPQGTSQLWQYSRRE